MTPRTIFVAALVWAVLVVIAVHFLDFPGSVPDFQHASGGGTLLDASPAFSSTGVYSRLDEYGEDGRRNYAFRNMTIDVLLPLSVLPFLFLMMRKAVMPFRFGQLLRAALLSLPVIYVVFDLLENSIVLVLLGNYPQRLDLLAVSLPYTTIVKRAASLLAMAVPLVMMGLNSVRSRAALRAS
jgi:hypothetical protein